MSIECDGVLDPGMIVGFCLSLGEISVEGSARVLYCRGLRYGLEFLFESDRQQFLLNQLLSSIMRRAELEFR